MSIFLRTEVEQLLEDKSDIASRKWRALYLLECHENKITKGTRLAN